MTHLKTLEKASHLRKLPFNMVFLVPPFTLKKHEYKYKKDRMDPETTLPQKFEKYLVTWINTCLKNGFPITKEQLCASVQKIVVNYKIPKKFKMNRRGYKWLKLFLQRHPSVAV